MRILPFLFTACFALTINAYGQTSEPQPESNVIYVSYANSDEAAFKIIGKKLLEKAYRIKKTEPTFFNIQTEYTSRDSYPFVFSMDVTAMDGKAIIRGHAKNDASGFDPYYGKGKGVMVPVIAFSFMYKFANQLKKELQEAQLSFGIEGK